MCPVISYISFENRNFLLTSAPVLSAALVSSALRQPLDVVFVHFDSSCPVVMISQMPKYQPAIFSPVVDHHRRFLLLLLQQFLDYLKSFVCFTLPLFYLLKNLQQHKKSSHSFYYKTTDERQDVQLKPSSVEVGESPQLPDLDALLEAVDLSFLDEVDWSLYQNFSPTSEAIEGALEVLNLPPPPGLTEQPYPLSAETEAALDLHDDHAHLDVPDGAPIVSDPYEQKHLNGLVAFLNGSLVTAPQLPVTAGLLEQLDAVMGDDGDLPKVDMNNYDLMLDDLDEYDWGMAPDWDELEDLFKPATMSVSETPPMIFPVTVDFQELPEPPPFTILEAVHIKAVPPKQSPPSPPPVLRRSNRLRSLPPPTTTVLIKTEPVEESLQPVYHPHHQSYRLRDRTKLSQPFKLQYDKLRPTKALSRRSPSGHLLEPKSEPEDSITPLPTTIIKKKKNGYIPRAQMTTEQREAARQRDREWAAARMQKLKKKRPDEVKKLTKRVKK